MSEPLPRRGEMGSVEPAWARSVEASRLRVEEVREGLCS